MTEQMEKAMAFLNGFETAGEFLAYCEGNGVKGARTHGHRCLIAQAVQRAIGAKDFRVGTVHLFMGLGEYMDIGALPGPIRDVRARFDDGHYPHLEA